MKVNTDASTYGQILADAFKEAGWKWSGSGDTGVDHYVAKLPSWLPGWGVNVATDPQHLLYHELFDAAVDALTEADKRGEQARKVLDRLTAEGVIT